MDWKYVTLPCPTCEFAHNFKRIVYWEIEGVYVGLYGGDDMKSRKECKQQLLFGESTYEALEGGNKSFNLSLAITTREVL